MRVVLILLLGLIISLFPEKNGIDPDHFHKNYENYRYTELSDRRYKHTRHINILHDLCDQNHYAELLNAGTSFEGREIFTVKWGRGKKRILLWTQMHGDEPTATLAFIDLLNFLEKDQDSDYLKALADSITFLGIPCLNPDGAVRYSRRNAQDIDINRDAIDLKTPEGRILDSIARAFQPIWALNLHDQSAYYTTDDSPRETHFSFQVPPIDKGNSSTEETIEVKKLISHVISHMGSVLDYAAIGRYPVNYSENAYGERFQQYGIKTLLIESGYKKDDPEKQELRRLHAGMFVQLLDAIAYDKYENASSDIYDNLPECKLNNHDLVIEHLKIPYKNAYRNSDLGFRKIFRTCQIEGELIPVSYLGTIGKPYVLKGEKYINGKYCHFEPITVYPDTLQALSDLNELDFNSLIEKGYFAFILRETTDSCNVAADFPFILNKAPSSGIRAGHPLSFILRGEQRENSILIHNGFVHRLNEIDREYIRNRIKYSVNEKDD